MAAESPLPRGEAPADVSTVVEALSHRLRNPLAVLVGYAELLKTRPDEAIRVDATDRIVEAADDLALVADDVLALLALELGGLSLDVQPVALADAAATALARVERRTTRFDLRHSPPWEEWPHVLGDPRAVAHVVTDVVLAACGCAPGTPTVELAAVAREGVAELRVTKDGWNLSPGDVETLLGTIRPMPFGYGSAIRPSGVELYAAGRLSERMGGAVTVEPGEATLLSLVITLPLADG
jgi:signal transduction histidine kinase